MPRITFIQPDGSRTSVEAVEGRSAMEAARQSAIRGIPGQCGGECACSTCHCYVDAEWLDRLPTKSAAEANLLDFVWDLKPESRLACQLIISETLDGLVLHVPERQL